MLNCCRPLPLCCESGSLLSFFPFLASFLTFYSNLIYLFSLIYRYIGKAINLFIKNYQFLNTACYSYFSFIQFCAIQLQRQLYCIFRFKLHIAKAFAYSSCIISNYSHKVNWPAFFEMNVHIFVKNVCVENGVESGKFFS